MASKQGAILAPVSSEDGGNGVGQVPEEPASRVEMAPRTRAATATVVGVEGGTLTWFQGILLRRRCDSCGTRISILEEAGDRVFMRCPECLREYVFSHRPE